MSLSSSGEWTAPPRRASRGLPHEKKHGTSHGKESFHRRSYRESNLLGALQGQSLRHKFAQQHVQVGN
jgi:hypothetical protein